MEKWVVTAASSNIYDNLLVSFVASLRENANWKGNIGIINYGLTPHQTWTLQKDKSNGIRVIPPQMKYKALIDDRFTTVGNYFKNRRALIAEWDSDVWFCKPIDEIFEMIRPGTLISTYDATQQGFMTTCLKLAQENINKFIAKASKKGHVMQGGFIASDNTGWYNFSGYQDTIIDLGIGDDSFGIDMVALNLFKYFYPDNFNMVGVEWNCLPDWVITKENENFYCRETKEPLKAIHVSSPHRNKYHMYETHYPENFKKWHNIFHS